MKVGLIFNKFSYKLHEENIRIVQKYFGLFPPLSLAWVAAIAEQAGHEVKIIDARTLGLSISETTKILKAYKPDIIGFMMTTYMFRETLEWAKQLKDALGVPVVIGGYNLRVYPQESLMNNVADFGCYKQSLKMFPAFLREFEGGRNFESVPGLVYKQKGRIIVNDPHPEEENFNAYPNPARHLLPNELYAEFPTERKNFTVMVTSLGCPNRCTFCEAGGTQYSPRNPDIVINEIDECAQKFGIREIDIFDYNFTGQRKRVEDICDGIITRGIDVTWACRSRIDNVDLPLLKKMHQAGCRRIYYGIESYNQNTLDTLHKQLSVEQIRETVDATNKVDIKTLGFFLVGVPGETRKSFMKTVNFASELRLDYAQFSKLTAKPLTSLWKTMVEETGEDYWKDYILGKVEEKQLPRNWTSLSNEEIDRLTKTAYLRLYLSPFFLWRAITKVSSIAEFIRKFMALIDMIFSQEDVSEKWLLKRRNFKAYNENMRAKTRRAKSKVTNFDTPKDMEHFL